MTTTTDADATDTLPRIDRITRKLPIAIGIYSFALVGLLRVAILSSGKKIDEQLF